jgi:hypothetical protein
MRPSAQSSAPRRDEQRVLSLPPSARSISPAVASGTRVRGAALEPRKALLSRRAVASRAACSLHFRAFIARAAMIPVTSAAGRGTHSIHP